MRRAVAGISLRRCRARLPATFSSLAGRHHDLGAQAGARLVEATVPKDKPLQAWELEAHALYASLSKAGCFSTDEVRRALEAMDPASYENWSYYEKMSAGMALVLRENGLVQPGELEREVYGEMLLSANDGPFAIGEDVIVRNEDSLQTVWRRPHLRTPGYLFGARGVVEQHMGEFEDPSLLAYGIKGAPALPLYRVRFRFVDLWSGVEPEEAETTVTVDVYGNWLQRRGDAKSLAFEPLDREMSLHGHSHDDSKDWDHGHGHTHGTRQQIERAAVDVEGPPRPGVAVHEALQRLMLRKGVVTLETLRATVLALETAGTNLPGASLVVAAWLDGEFKRRLLADGNEAALEKGIVASNPNAPTKLVVVANTARRHNLVVCTLCSCYPASLLGPAPLWYKSSAYRARAVRRPRRLLEEAFGLRLPLDTTVAVHDSTADCRYLVLPVRPLGTVGWSETALCNLVTRDAMLGTAFCRVPSV